MKLSMALLAVVLAASNVAAADHAADVAKDSERVRERAIRQLEQAKALVLTRLPAGGEPAPLTLERSWWESLRGAMRATTRLKSPRPQLAMDDTTLVGWRITAGGATTGARIDLDFRDSWIHFESGTGEWSLFGMGDDPDVYLRLVRLAQPADADMKSLAARQPLPPPNAPDAEPRLGQYVYVEELPEPIHKVAPDYPEDARRRGVQGTVVVQALLGKDGLVRRTQLVKGVAGLDEAAEACVRQWRFKPAMSKGEPVAVWVAVPVAFKLR